MLMPLYIYIYISFGDFSFLTALKEQSQNRFVSEFVFSSSLVEVGLPHAGLYDYSHRVVVFLGAVCSVRHRGRRHAFSVLLSEPVHVRHTIWDLNSSHIAFYLFLCLL